MRSGGEGGIRTHGTRKGTTVFETVPIDHSGTSPRRAPDGGWAAVRVEGRRTWFETIEEMQAVLDEYLEGYNTKRPHQGRGMNGRTPIRAFT